MDHLHQLHLATEVPEHPPPVVEKAWYRVLIAVLGFLLGAGLMWMTDFEPPGQTFKIVP